MTNKINQSPKITIIIDAGASSDFYPKEFSKEKNIFLNLKIINITQHLKKISNTFSSIIKNLTTYNQQ
jgi:hypothetical protein